MNKFKVLLLKEIRELLTPQMILPFVIIMLVFSFIGNIMSSEQERQAENTHIYVLDQDNSEVSQIVTQTLSDLFPNVETVTGKTQNALLTQMKENKEQSLLVIPESFSEDISAGNKPKIESISMFYSFSVISNLSVSQIPTITTAIDEIVGSYLLTKEHDIANPQDIRHPVTFDYTVTINEYSANVDPNAILGFVSMQTMIVPIVLFLVITVAAQLVATAVANEKENKTLETLLSSPVSRQMIVATKLIGAGIVSLLMAGAYLYGMKNYMEGITGGAMSEATTQISTAVEQLHLSLGMQDYLILGVSLFLAIMTALSFAFIIGAFAEDTRSAQSAIAPIMMMLLVPYLLSMLLDISSLSGWLKTLLFALPFTHTFLTMPNLFAENYTAILWGNVYLLVLVMVAIFAASKIFSSDTLLTFKLPSFGKKG